MQGTPSMKMPRALVIPVFRSGLTVRVLRLNHIHSKESRKLVEDKIKLEHRENVCHGPVCICSVTIQSCGAQSS